MFTVCPKCALTLVVTAQDLRVAQGYVRCGRCSNVFNAIVGLTDDRGALASSQGTASTSTIRKAPSIEDEPTTDPLTDTGETEAIYAEPDAEEVKFQEVFVEPAPSSAARTPGPISFVAPPPGPPVKAPPTPGTTSPERRYSDTEGIEKRYSDTEGAEKRYSDTEGIDTIPGSELEFNPALTDVRQVFVEAAPVAFKGNAVTGRFEKIVLRPEDREPAKPAASAARPAQAPPPPAQKPAAPAQGSVQAAAPKPAPAVASKPAAAKPTSPQPAVQKPATPPRPAPPQRDEEDIEIDDDLRTLAMHLDVTASRPGPKLPLAANEESIEARARRDAEAAAEEEAEAGGFLVPRDAGNDEDDEDRSLGDIYAKATPRPSPPLKPGKGAAAARSGSAPLTASLDDDDELKVDVAADSLAPSRARPSASRGRSLLLAGGGVALLLALVSQVIHHNRHELATNAALNRPLTRLYAALGVPLVPNWNLNLYDVRQLGASTNENGTGTLTVRASLKNNATQSLPLPLLRITMQDRYGNPIATRDVLPTGYVPGAVPDGARIGAGQRLDAEMTFEDPGQDAVGFEIDACLPSSSGRIACANDGAVPSR